MELVQEFYYAELWNTARFAGTAFMMLVFLIGLPYVLPDTNSRKRVFVLYVALIFGITTLVILLDKSVGLWMSLIPSFLFMGIIALLLDKSQWFTNITMPLVGPASHTIKLVVKFGVGPIVVLLLPFSYFFLYGLSYPPCGLQTENISLTSLEKQLEIKYGGNRLAYLTWLPVESSRYHEVQFCKEPFLSISGEISKSILPVYISNKKEVSPYTGMRVEEPIDQNEIFIVLDKVKVSCSGYSCKDFEEGTYYVLKNSKGEQWAIVEEMFDRF